MYLNCIEQHFLLPVIPFIKHIMSKLYDIVAKLISETSDV